MHEVQSSASNKWLMLPIIELPIDEPGIWVGAYKSTIGTFQVLCNLISLHKCRHEVISPQGWSQVIWSPLDGAKWRPLAFSPFSASQDLVALGQTFVLVI